MLRDFWRASLHDQCVLAVQLVQELRVVLNALDQGLRLQLGYVLLLRLLLGRLGLFGLLMIRGISSCGGRCCGRCIARFCDQEACIGARASLVSGSCA